jgi:uncharacterized protein YkwD
VANPLDIHERTAFDAVNEIRTAAGVTPLTECASLNVSASRHSDDMRDKGYLDDNGPDGATPKTRACAAGYVTACGDTAMAELVAAGNGDGQLTVDQWKADTTTGPLMVDPLFTVGGIGRALFGERPIWTLDMAPVNEPSCAP